MSAATVVVRIAEFHAKPAFHDDPATLAAFRAWMAGQPGFRHAWHATDPETGNAISVSVWDDLASLRALRSRPFPGGPLLATPDRVTIWENAEAFREEGACSATSY